MRFAEEEIELAKQFDELSLDWEPRAGHYVLDVTEFCQQPSPFQDRVYFILNYDYFMKAVGGVDRFKEIMVWLPTWEDAREILHSLEVTDESVEQQLQDGQAIANRSERIVLYRLIHAALLQRHNS